jgi:hypothetical protein
VKTIQQDYIEKKTCFFLANNPSAAKILYSGRQIIHTRQDGNLSKDNGSKH